MIRELLVAARDFAGLAVMLTAVAVGYATANPPAPTERLARPAHHIEAKAR